VEWKFHWVLTTFSLHCSRSQPAIRLLAMLSWADSSPQVEIYCNQRHIHTGLPSFFIIVSRSAWRGTCCVVSCCVVGQVIDISRRTSPQYIYSAMTIMDFRERHELERKYCSCGPAALSRVTAIGKSRNKQESMKSQHFNMNLIKRCREEMRITQSEFPFNTLCTATIYTGRPRKKARCPFRIIFMWAKLSGLLLAL
jgi:hypothetical protein